MKSARQSFLFTLLAGLLLPFTASGQAPPVSDGLKHRPPNIVIFLSDDHTLRDASLYGSTEITTPNMDRVAALGMTFDRAFVASPSCGPSRASLLTGFYPARHGAEPNHVYPGTLANPKKLPAYFQELGYQVVSFGKVGHYKQTADYGFDLAQDFSYANRDAIDNAVKWLQNRTSTQPLCIFVGTNWPHVPWPEDSTEFPPAKVQIPPTQVDTPNTRTFRSRYLAAVRHMDNELGKVYDAAAAKFGKDFFFLHTSDHGAQFPFAKWNLYEDGTRTPFVVTWPGEIRPSTRSDAMISWLDVLPTLVEVAGGKPPANLDGSSILPILRGKATTHRTSIFTTHSGDGKVNVYPMRAVRSDDGWKYIRNLHPEFLYTSHITGQREYWFSWVGKARTDTNAAQRVRAYQYRPPAELYDLNNDPLELNNLIANPAQAARIAKLSGQLDEWMRQTGDQKSVFGPPTHPPSPSSEPSPKPPAVKP